MLPLGSSSSVVSRVALRLPLAATGGVLHSDESSWAIGEDGKRKSKASPPSIMFRRLCQLGMVCVLSSIPVFGIFVFLPTVVSK